MVDRVDFDPALAGPWPSGAVRLAPYGTGVDPGLDEAVRDVWLEVKAASEPGPAARLQALLNEMTDELKAQFDVFRKIRADAEAKLGAGSDEAEQKLAKADIKSASDALSLIVRTIEKIDSLQRSLAHDREAAIEQEFDQAAYEQLLAETERIIERRAAERLATLCLAGSGPPVRNDTGPPEPE